jgi:hypothetical protein
MEFVLELSVVTAAIILVVVGLSIAILYPSGGYKSKIAAIVTPAILAILVAASGPEDHTSLGEWTYYALPTLLVGPLFVSYLCHWKRIREGVTR